MEIFFLFSMIDTLKNYFGDLSILSSDFQELKLRVSAMLPSFNLSDDSTSNFLINGLANMQDTMASLSTSESSLVSAPVLLLAAGVVHFLWSDWRIIL